MHVLIIVFDPVIGKTPDAPLHCLPFCKVKSFFTPIFRWHSFCIPRRDSQAELA